MKRAFVAGSNGPVDHAPLKFARTDAIEIANSLRSLRCGFEVAHATRRDDASSRVRQRLIDEVEGCTEQDTFVCYFSGHGILDNGSLFILWNDTKLDRLLSTSIPASDITQALAYCKARSRLLILDCCHAGAAAKGFNFKDSVGLPIEDTFVKPENYLVLVASSRLEKALEIDELGGSFLAHAICDALGPKFSLVSDENKKRLSILDLKRFLETEAITYKDNHPTVPVPIPYLFGQLKGDLFLTTDVSEWREYKIGWPDGSMMVLLPIQPVGRYGLCISRDPVSNLQYKNSNLPEPVGKRWKRYKRAVKARDSQPKKGFWTGPFSPWRDESFNLPNQPVVCVSYSDATKYAQEVQSRVRTKDTFTNLPLSAVWDYAAFGTQFPPRRNDSWLQTTRTIHHRASAPSVIDSEGSRTNALGITDMIGNVWEWCKDTEDRPVLAPVRSRGAALRGGGFLDDLTRSGVFLRASELTDGFDTRHSDLGFRLSALVPVDNLPEEVKQTLFLCPKLEDVDLEVLRQDS